MSKETRERLEWELPHKFPSLISWFLVLKSNLLQNETRHHHFMWVLGEKCMIFKYSLCRQRIWRRRRRRPLISKNIIRFWEWSSRETGVLWYIIPYLSSLTNLTVISVQEIQVIVFSCWCSGRVPVHVVCLSLLPAIISNQKVYYVSLLSSLSDYFSCCCCDFRSSSCCFIIGRLVSWGHRVLHPGVSWEGLSSRFPLFSLSPRVLVITGNLLFIGILADSFRNYTLLNVDHYNRDIRMWMLFYSRVWKTAPLSLFFLVSWK